MMSEDFISIHFGESVRMFLIVHGIVASREVDAELFCCRMEVQ